MLIQILIQHYSNIILTLNPLTLEFRHYRVFVFSERILTISSFTVTRVAFPRFHCVSAAPMLRRFARLLFNDRWMGFCLSRQPGVHTAETLLSCSLLLLHYHYISGSIPSQILLFFSRGGWVPWPFQHFSPPNRMRIQIWCLLIWYLPSPRPLLLDIFWLFIRFYFIPKPSISTTTMPSVRQVRRITQRRQTGRRRLWVPQRAPWQL